MNDTLPFEPGKVLRDKQWHKAVTKPVVYCSGSQAQGEMPSCRVGAACVYHSPSQCLYVIGGADPAGLANDVWRLDLVTFKWHTCSADRFVPCYEASVVCPPCAPDKIYVFGGALTVRNINIVQRYDVEQDSWTLATTSGEPPSPRTQHSPCLGPKNRLIVFGGGHKGSVPVPENQLHILDLGTLQWSQPQTSGPAPCPRLGHVTCCIGGNVFVHGGLAGNDMFGDLYRLDMTTWTWSEEASSGCRPPPRASHSAVTVGELVYIFGGLSEQRTTLGDLWELETGSMVWSEVNVAGNIPRLSHSLCAVNLPAKKRRRRVSERLSESLKQLSLDESGGPAMSPQLPARSNSVTSPSSEDPDRCTETNSTTLAAVVFGGMNLDGCILGDVHFLKIPC